MRVFTLFVFLVFQIYGILGARAAEKNNNKKTFQRAGVLINEGRYPEAIKELKGISDVGSDIGELNYLLGLSYAFMDFHQEDVINYMGEASKFFSVAANPNQRGIECRYYLAQAYHQVGEVEKALDIYSLIRKNISPGQVEVVQKVDQEINYCKNTIELKKNPVDFRITNLGELINTKYDEHSPVITFDEEMMIFTSNRPSSYSVGVNENIQEDIFITRWNGKNWTPAENIGNVINGIGSDATISLSPDGSSLFIYRNNGMDGDIFIAKMVKGVWTVPEKLPKPINSSANETHVSMSLDESTLYFTSDRSGGYGGKDIYVVKKLPNGAWGKEQNLGMSINTPYDEESPFLHADGRTLYFCSMGHNSMGGYDVFKSELDENGEWSYPQNIGYPINTVDDELFYQPTVDGQRVYFAAYRKEGKGASDIYLIEYPNTDTRSMAVIKGRVVLDEIPEKAVQLIVKSEEGNEIGEYRANKETGKFVLILPAGNKYSVLINLNENMSKNIDVSVPLRTEFESTKAVIELGDIKLKSTEE